jgi:hypothetical protein
MMQELFRMARNLRLRKSRLRCSFCGRSADQVGRLVAGPSVYICDMCIEACVAVLDRHGGHSVAADAGSNR